MKANKQDSDEKMMQFKAEIKSNKKVALVRVDGDGAVARSSEFMKTYHNMNIIVQTTGGYASSFNG